MLLSLLSTNTTAPSFSLSLIIERKKKRKKKVQATYGRSRIEGRLRFNFEQESHWRETDSYHAVANSQERVELELRSIAEQENVLSVLVARVCAVSEILRSFNHGIQRGSEGLSTTWSKKSHSCGFDQSLEVFQRGECRAAVPILLLRTLKLIDDSIFVVSK